MFRSNRSVLALSSVFYALTARSSIPNTPMARFSDFPRFGMYAVAAFLLLTTPSFGSFFEVCEVTVEVVSLEELSVFGKGSSSVPVGVNSDCEESNTFMNLLTLKVVEVGTQEGATGHTRCNDMLDRDYKVILDSKVVLEGAKPGDRLKLTRSRMNNRTHNGVAYGETWSRQ